METEMIMTTPFFCAYMDLSEVTVRKADLIVHITLAEAVQLRDFLNQLELPKTS